jgi:DNA ligase 1
MLFIDLANAFDEIEKTSSRLGMTRQLGVLFARVTPEEAKIISYLALGVLKPPYVGTQFGIAEKSMVKIVATHLSTSEQAVRDSLYISGDIGAVIASNNWECDNNLSIKDVYARLCELEIMSGIGSQEHKAQYLLALFKNLDPVAAKYIIRIILGKLQLGFSAMTIIDSLSLMLVGDKSIRDIIENAFNRCADIGYIAYVAKKTGIDGLKNVSVVVGIPIRPAAAERMPDAYAIMKKINPAVAQPKLDGFRLQIHVNKTKEKTEVHFFSRNLLDMTGMFPELAQLFTDLDVQSLICDSEAIGYDENSGKFVPFQETVKRKRKHNIEAVAQDLPLQVFVFDVLYVNGQEIMNQSGQERREILKNIISRGDEQFREVVHVIDEIEITSPEHLEHYFYTTIENGLEGLIIKKPGAVYQPGKRNFNWIKLKRVESGELDDTLDVVILGYYKGRGKRASFGIGALLVGVRNQETGCFETIAKIGTGLSDQEWIDVRSRCDERIMNHQPHNVVCSQELFPDVWVDPAIVCMVRADEITQSPVHTAAHNKDTLGLALRFPRFMGYRFDKSVDESTTVQEVRDLYTMQYAKKHA